MYLNPICVYGIGTNIGHIRRSGALDISAKIVPTLASATSALSHGANFILKGICSKASGRSSRRRTARVRLLLLRRKTLMIAIVIVKYTYFIKYKKTNYARFRKEISPYLLLNNL